MKNAFILILAFFAVLSANHIALCAPATRPTTLPGRLVLPESPTAIPWTNLSEFLPARNAQGNAAERYAEAAKTIRTLPGFPSLPGNEKTFMANATLQQALNHAFEGSTCASADFLSMYSYQVWQKDSVPDLAAALVLAKALGRSAAIFCANGQNDKALAAAQCAISMGEHYRSGAPSIAQALVAEDMISEGLRACRIVCARSNDKAKARRAAETLAATEGLGAAIEARSAAASAAQWQNPTLALHAFQDPDALIRADALLLVEACLNPQGAQLVLAAKETQPVATMLRSEAKQVQSAIQPLLTDKNPIVRKLAERTITSFSTQSNRPSMTVKSEKAR